MYQLAREQRGNQTYYYRARRENGRVVKEYMGSGEFGELMYQIDRLDAERRKLERMDLHWSNEAKEETVAVFCHDALAVARLFLMAEGYNQHNRGEWRKKRMATEKRTSGQKDICGTPVDTDEQRAAVVRNALHSKDPAVLALATSIVREHPDVICTTYLRDVDSVLDGISEGGNKVTRLLLENEAAKVRRELFASRERGVIPYAERLLIERVIACKFALSSAERGAHGSHTLQKAEYLQRTIDRAHKRYLSAIETLARVRRLALPVVAVALPGSTQINIGDKQINITAVGDLASSNVTVG